jgi:hypothetical protein
MGTVVGNQIAGSLPKALQSMLNVLVASNNLRSWQIYNDSLGISVRLRFDHDGGCVDRGDREGNVYMQSSQPNTAQQTQPTAYCKKSPSHVKRDTHRKISRAKRQRTENFDEIEDERKSEVTQEHYGIVDSPTCVCEPPPEDTLILSPVMPISVDFVSDICDQAVGPMLIDPEKNIESTQSHYDSDGEYKELLKCPNCDEMMAWDHTCNISESVEIVEQISDAEERENATAFQPPPKPPDHSNAESKMDDDERAERMARTIEAVLREMYKL